MTHSIACFLPSASTERQNPLRQECLAMKSFDQTGESESFTFRWLKYNLFCLSKIAFFSALVSLVSLQRQCICSLYVFWWQACGLQSFYSLRCCRSPPLVWSSEVCNLPEPQHHHPDSFLRVKMTQNPAGHTAGKKDTRAQFDSLDEVPVEQRSMGRKKLNCGNLTEGIRFFIGPGSGIMTLGSHVFLVWKLISFFHQQQYLKHLNTVAGWIHFVSCLYRHWYATLWLQSEKQ